tara:strand:+ start:209 stop:322 length:114 start_codon:yes stop_codon:yes gene_type:complete
MMLSYCDKNFDDTLLVDIYGYSFFIAINVLRVSIVGK